MKDLIIKQIFISIATVNWEGLIRFYSQLLGVNPTQLIPGKYAEFMINSVKIAIFTPKAEHTTEFNQPQQSPLSLCMIVEDLNNAIACLKSIDYPHTLSIHIASHGREIYVYDPDGNRIILYQPQSSKYT